MSHKRMHERGGFTLIEVLVVIVLLGILSAVTLPRFIGLQGDARYTKGQAIQATIKVAMTQARQAAVNAGGDPKKVVLEGEEIAMAYGYPIASAVPDTGILAAANISAKEDRLMITSAGTTPAAITIDIHGVREPGQCRIVYTEATASTPASVSFNAKGPSSCD